MKVPDFAALTSVLDPRTGQITLHALDFNGRVWQKIGNGAWNRLSDYTLHPEGQ